MVGDTFRRGAGRWLDMILFSLVGFVLRTAFSTVIRIATVAALIVGVLYAGPYFGWW